MLNDTFRFISIKVSERVTNFHTCYKSCVLCQEILSSFNIGLGTINFCYFVAVDCHIPVYSIGEVLSDMIIPVKGYFNTGVAYGTGILPLMIETCSRCNRNIEQQIFGLFVIPVECDTKMTA